MRGFRGPIWMPSQVFRVNNAHEQSYLPFYGLQAMTPPSDSTMQCYRRVYEL